VSPPRVALATDRHHPDLDEDGPVLRAALDAAGVRAEPVVWDDPAVRWSSYDLVVVRCTWDYVPRRDEWLAWAEGLPRVANPADVLRWSTDKRYLRGLAGAGVPVVPTTWLEPGDDVVLPEAAEVVVKPVVSAGSADTLRHTDRRAAREHAARLLGAGRGVMVQPYLPAVDTAGETAVVHLGGRPSHGARKGAMLAPDRAVDDVDAEERTAPRAPSPGEAALADRVLDLVPGGRDRLLYARVDLLPGPDGAPVVVEVELAEPSLFLRHAPGSAERLAAAVRALLATA